MAKMRIDGQNFSEIRWKFLDFFYLIIPSNDQMRITFKMEMKILIAINDEEEEEKMKWKMLIELQSSAQLECFNSIYVNWMQIKREREGEVQANFSLFNFFFIFLNRWIIEASEGREKNVKISNRWGMKKARISLKFCFVWFLMKFCIDRMAFECVCELEMEINI